MRRIEYGWRFVSADGQRGRVTPDYVSMAGAARDAGGRLLLDAEMGVRGGTAEVVRVREWCDRENDWLAEVVATVDLVPRLTKP